MADADSLWKTWPLSPGTRVHLVGICGSGMRALAEVLHEAGCRLTGSDLDPHPEAWESLRQRGIPVYAGHARRGGFVPAATQQWERLDHVGITCTVSRNCSPFVTPRPWEPPPDLLIYSPAVGPGNPERQTAARLGVPQLSYVDVLGKLMRSRTGVAVAGTHGKSTTTAMLGEILTRADADPTVVCGAAIQGSNRSGRLGNGELFVVEACEYRRHFLHLDPKIVCLLGIEPDHFDCYPTPASALDAYRELVRRVPRDGTIVYRSDCPSTSRVVQDSAARKVCYSITDSRADWFADGIEPVGGGVRFTMHPPERLDVSQPRPAAIHLPQPGRHNVHNALAAAATAGVLGIGAGQIVRALGSFPGLRRRFERIGHWRNARVIDDFAHHPTEIAVTIAAARETYAPQRAVCVFQPHQVSRTRALLDEFGKALATADRCYVLPVYGARERTEEENIPVAQQLVSTIGHCGGESGFIPALDQVWATLETGEPEADLILILGAGDISRLFKPADGVWWDSVTGTEEPES